MDFIDEALDEIGVLQCGCKVDYDIMMIIDQVDCTAGHTDQEAVDNPTDVGV